MLNPVIDGAKIHRYLWVAEASAARALFALLIAVFPGN